MYDDKMAAVRMRLRGTCNQTCWLAEACTILLLLQNILVAGKPHLGTDRLIKILQAFRQHLTALGVKIHFGCCVTDLVIQHNRAVGVKLTGDQPYFFATSLCHTCSSYIHSHMIGSQTSSALYGSVSLSFSSVML